MEYISDAPELYWKITKTAIPVSIGIAAAKSIFQHFTTAPEKRGSFTELLFLTSGTSLWAVTNWPFVLVSWPILRLQGKTVNYKFSVTFTKTYVTTSSTHKLKEV